MKTYCVHVHGNNAPLSKPMELYKALDLMITLQRSSNEDLEVLPHVEPALHSARCGTGKGSTVWRIAKTLVFCAFAVVYVLFVLIPSEKSSN